MANTLHTGRRFFIKEKWVAVQLLKRYDTPGGRFWLCEVIRANGVMRENRYHEGQEIRVGVAVLERAIDLDFQDARR